MSERLQREYVVNRERRRKAEKLGRARIGPAPVKTLKNWISAYRDESNGGLFGLVDGRSRRKYNAFDSLDPEVHRLVEEQMDALDGSRSDLNLDELFRRTVLAVKAEGLLDL
ncbi:hypothetical protein [Brevibacterium sp. FME17]|uniref:hypothetical protein n=1 Tax=Brevibacterium sp. FME17 TaxID=2742606 RepID=UPI0018695BDE|nr:hypothetical protein [Brevibacterium sp. FME17]